MTAKEMFESLGWDCTRDDNEEIVYVDEGDTLTFNKTEKRIDASLLTWGERCVVEYTFNIDLLKAINKQIEELGW